MMNSTRLLGCFVALLAFAADQAHKYWMIFIYDIAQRGPVMVTSFFDLILTWNRGISYSLFTGHEEERRWLLVAMMLIVSLLVFIWMLRTTQKLAVIGMGLIVGGALGNALDRILHGAVADFFLFHIGNFTWYVFNIADVAISVGGGLIVLQLLLTPKTTKSA